MAPQPIDPHALRAFTAAVFMAVGVPAPDAHLVADSLVQADLWGHQSHGVLRAGWYVARLRSGVMTPVAEPAFVIDAGAIAVLDGRHGIGQVLTARAMDEAIRRAKQYGVGVVAVRNSNHFGTAFYFTRTAAEEGCIALLTTNGSPAMAPWGGRTKTVGANPWSVAAPAGRYGVMVMDIANTAVARGKIYVARQQGVPIPLGWALDAAGTPTTDPLAALEGVVLPMAGHKGYAIALIMDVLSGVLTGSGFGTAVHGPYQSAQRSHCGHLIIALNVEAFQPLAAFHARMERLITEIKAAPLAQDAEAIFFPGELEARNEVHNRRDGLVFPEQTLTDLAALARETGLEAALPFPVSSACDTPVPGCRFLR
ncbi:MAG: Ldh family oxidoreductase [Chloroflexi bacterium OHK40]